MRMARPSEMGFPTTSLLAEIPLELLYRIADFLSTLDLGSLRRTCKSIERRLFDYFSSHFFRKKQFMLTGPSLNALRDISRHEHLSPRLRHLVIGLDHFTNVPIGFPHPPDETALLRLKAESDVAWLLRDSGGSIDILREALGNLKNIHTVELRDFNSRTRFRDLGSGSDSWRSWGAAALEAQGYKMEMGDSPNASTGTSICNQTFIKVLSAMAQAPTRPQALMVIHRLQGQGLGDSAFNLHPLWSHVETAEAVLAGLKTLHLDINIHDMHSYLPSNCVTNSGQDIFEPFSNNFRCFLAKTPNVTWFRLNFRSMSKEMSFRLINWLATPPEYSPSYNPLPWSQTIVGPLDGTHVPPPWGEINPRPVTMPLVQLDLGFGHISGHVLQKLLRKFNRIQTVSLFNMVMHPPSTDDLRHRHNAWAGIFNKIAVDLPPALKLLHLRCLKQYGNVFPVRIDLEDNIKVAVSEASLKQLASAMNVYCAGIDPPDMSDAEW